MEMTPESLVKPKARKKVYSETLNVYDAAKARLRYLKAKYDNLTIAFSGGKDSLAIISLLEKVNEEDGDTRKINIMFRDEEVINDSIVEFVRGFAESGKYNFTWFAYPMLVGAYFMGEYSPLVAWDPNREHIRTPPSYAVTTLGVDTSAMDEFKIASYEKPFLNINGTVCVLLGLRASESIKRLTALTCKEKDNYIGKPIGLDLVTASPLYDWEEFDIFKLFYEHNTTYCPVYNSQMWKHINYRVASSLHDKAIDKLRVMKEMEPEYFEKLKKLFPEVETQVRYSHAVNYWVKAKGYPPTFNGVRQYIEDNLHDDFKKMALDYVDTSERVRLRKEKELLLGGVPIRRVFDQVIKGKYWGEMVKLVEPSAKDLDYERYGYED